LFHNHQFHQALLDKLFKKTKKRYTFTATSKIEEVVTYEKRVNKLKDSFILENQLCFSVYEVNNQFNKLYTKVLQDFGLTYPQYLTLLVLWEKNGLTVKEIGERLNLGTGTLTPMIKRMEANGWVKKERSSVDERKVSIFLQPKAIKEKQAIIEKIAAEVNSCNIEFQEYAKLMSQLNLLQKMLEQQNKSLSK